jgi:hypothetical protein
VGNVKAIKWANKNIRSYIVGFTTKCCIDTPFTRPVTFFACRIGSMPQCDSYNLPFPVFPQSLDARCCTLACRCCYYV